VPSQQQWDARETLAHRLDFARISTTVIQPRDSICILEELGAQYIMFFVFRKVILNAEAGF
jgi:hypothetical protein